MSTHKLLPVARRIAQMLEKTFGIPAVFRLDEPLAQLPLDPDRQAFPKTWPILEEAYSAINDHRWHLEERLVAGGNSRQWEPARVDIFFEHPYSLIVEFDEKQHFSQFRLRTLLIEKSFGVTVNMDWQNYLSHCRERYILPGISGFQKIKTADPLFPEIYPGQKQNNRPRQRAFRDLMKDLLPLENTMNPTLRISYRETAEVIKDFTEKELYAIEQSLLNREFPASLKIF